MRATLDRVATARAILTGILDSWEQTGSTYAELGTGSTQPQLGNAAAYLEHAYDQVRRIIATLDLAATHAHGYVTSIAGQLTPDQVTALRRQLPEPIKPAERGTGRKTHGRWIDADGTVREMVSGEDEFSSKANRYLTILGIRKTPWTVNHVELKLAARLREQHDLTGRPQHTTLVLNNVPCPGRLGCASLLPRLLPAGCSLTVHGPNYQRTFIGDTTS